MSTHKLKIMFIFLLGILLLSAANLAAAEPLVCCDYSFEVNLSPDNPVVYNVVGTLCSRGSLEGKTVQLLVSGATYSRMYWDFPFQPDHYSYVHTATEKGYVTLNLERIGIGVSDHPDGNMVNVSSNAHVAHQVIQALRNGDVGGVAFGKVIIVGHSLGSVVSIELAAQYPGDVDGIILTGFIHNLNPDLIDIGLNNYFYPATLDPRFLGQFPNYDYFTTVPGSREMLFYYLPAANPDVIAVDEGNKETISLGELEETVDLFNDTTSLLIDVPVMAIIGEFDLIFCGGDVDCSDKDMVQSHEEEFFGPEACVQTFVVEDSCHDLNLHTNAHEAYAKMIHWADRMVGKGPGSPPESCW